MEVLRGEKEVSKNADLASAWCWWSSLSEAYLRSCVFTLYDLEIFLISALAYKPNGWMAQIQSAGGTSVLRVLVI